jgi:hypothetical protein
VRTINLLLGTVGIMVVALLAQSDADYQGWMKTVVATNGKMQKNIAAKSPDAAADAKTLESTFKQVEDFWAKRNASDAVGFAKQAQTAAASVQKSVAAGNFDQAATEAKGIGATCQGCHAAHREKTDSGFKIK